MAAQTSSVSERHREGSPPRWVEKAFAPEVCITGRSVGGIGVICVCIGTYVDVVHRRAELLARVRERLDEALCDARAGRMDEVDDDRD